MSAFFQWMANLPSLLQVLVILGAFAIVVALILFFIELAPRRGRGYSIMRLIVAIAVPAIIVLVLGVYNDAVWLVPVAAVLGAGLFLLDRRARGGTGSILQLTAFMFPAVFLLAIGLLYPTIKTIIDAFLSNDGSKFVGLANFVYIFSPANQGVLALVNQIVWVIITPVLATAIGLAYAVFVDRSRGEKVLKVFVFMPVAISLVGASIIFKFFFDYQQGAQIGVLNQIVVLFGGTPVSWLQTPFVNTALLIIVLIWTQTGFAMVLLSAAIKGIPDEQVEASELDGANAFQRFRNVTIPGIRPTIIVVWVTIAIVSLKVYDVIAATTTGQNDSTVISYQMVRLFQNLPPQNGGSSAEAVILFILILPFLIYNANNIRKQRLGL
ncbi:MAG TPA: sugar ABC transporter permease [Galbitalea sp.]|jgi:alpha-glucoside transport system permease protein|nr:sugar ABC transporter permease [Galbitalea sp.]